MIKFKLCFSKFKEFQGLNHLKEYGLQASAYHDKEWCHVSDSVCLKREEGTEETRDNYKQCKQGSLQCISKISRVHMCVTVGTLT